MGYRDVSLDLDGGHVIQVKAIHISSNVTQFKFPWEISQSTLGGRQGSNVCTLIAVLFGAYCLKNDLDISLVWDELPQIWPKCFTKKYVMERVYMMNFVLTLLSIWMLKM